ncbi:hypothetical protein [Saccharopolyspora mangrovi]|uniref:Uncharacterized protein n=1 Tax=Saccharopolyspora mangrovi TaxID=3082379 RepID=A0ABU6AF01_9PSEU|nr:hypothetical protein [Saccharopolyspora sp. S2-29]MEB3370114.1 hypothetical protein [Saccharopolyspora sp. S2-29]
MTRLFKWVRTGPIFRGHRARQEDQSMTGTGGRFTADDIAHWDHTVVPEQPTPGEEADLSELIELLSTDLDDAIDATLDQRSAEPARRFARRVAETDLLMALEEPESDEVAETLGSTVLFVLVVSRLTRALHASPEEGLAGAAVASLREHIGTECAELAHEAISLLDGPEPRERGIELGDEVLLSLILLAAGFALRDCQNSPELLRSHEPCWHDEDSTVS